MNDPSRRRFLQLSGTGLALAGTGGLLSACTSGAAANQGTVQGGAVKRGGTLRVGVTGGASSDTLDAQNIVTNPDFARIPQLYDPLVWINAKGQVELVLAESIEPDRSALHWTIRVHKGVTTHDGKAFGAKDVLYSLRRIVAKKYPGAAALGPVDFAGSKILDQRTLLLSYSKPYSILTEALSIVYFFMVPEGYDPAHPVGTGPFKYKSFTAGVQSTFARNDNYWQSGVPYLDSVVITDVSDETAQVNGLQSGQLDAIVYLSAGSAASLQGSGLQVRTSRTGSWGPITMRVDRAPFSDVRVRQAFRLLVDREQMRRQVFGPYGSIGNDVFGVFDKDFDHSLPQREQDIEQAKSLLAAAGHQNLTVQLTTSTFAPGMVQAAQVFATQAKAAGVTVSINQQTPTNYFARDYLKVPFSQDYWPYQPYLVAVSQATLTGAPFSATHFDDLAYNSLFEQATMTTDDAKKKEIVSQMLHIDYNQGGNIIPYFFPNIDAMSASVRGVVESVDGQGLNSFNLRRVWLA